MDGDLISRSALLENEQWFVDYYGDLKDFPYIDVEDVYNAPAVDAVEVVRCKDCIHYEMGVCLKIYSDGAVSAYAWQGRKEDDFCSRGERREENAAD